MLNTVQKLYEILDRRERRRVAMVLALMIAVAMFEVVGVASIMPFMAVLSNPELIDTNQYLRHVYQRLAFESPRSFMLFLGGLFLILIVLSLALRAVAFWVQFRFAAMRSHEWSCRLAEKYLGRPYEWFLGQHSGTLSSSVLHEVNQMVHGSLFPLMGLLSQAFVAVLLTLLLVVVDSVLAISTAVVLGGAYGILYLAARRLLARLGEEILEANRRRYKLALEMFGGIKDVKVSGFEWSFLRQYREASLRSAERQVVAKTLGEIPSFAMQALVFGGIVVVLLYVLVKQGDLQSALPVFSVYALAGYRLMPALQAVYRHLSEIRTSEAVLERVHAAWVSAASQDVIGDSSDTAKPSKEAIRLEKCLRLECVSYRYPGSDRWALRNIELLIPARSTVGLVGTTGAGKTTLVDVILGLLQPEAGVLRVDEQVLTQEGRRAWQRNIGYVPQQIFLSDDTVTANIAFGVPPENVERPRVERAARLANLHSFIMEGLPNGYDTVVGERGVRLSGGQRQRIGIARALYSDPAVLLLDEATSALDGVTEHAVMDAVRNLGGKKTIIVVAHRLSTVRECDAIFIMEKGELVARGTYDALLETSPQFRKLAAGGGDPFR